MKNLCYFSFSLATHPLTHSISVDQPASVSLRHSHAPLLPPLSISPRLCSGHLSSSSLLSALSFLRARRESSSSCEPYHRLRETSSLRTKAGRTANASAIAGVLSMCAGCKSNRHENPGKVGFVSWRVEVSIEGRSAAAQTRARRRGGLELAPFHVLI